MMLGAKIPNYDTCERGLLQKFLRTILQQPYFVCFFGSGIEEVTGAW